MCESVDNILFRLTALPTLLARIGCDHSVREREAHLEEETALLSAEAERLQRCAAALQARHRARSLVRDYERAVCRVLTRMCGGPCAAAAESFQQVEAAALLRPRSHLASAWERYKAAHPLPRFYDVCDALHSEEGGAGGSAGEGPDPGLLSLMAARLREEHCGLLPLCALQGPPEACSLPPERPVQRCVYERPPPPKRRSFVERQQRRRRRKARHEARAACPQQPPCPVACSEPHAGEAPQGELVPDDILDWGEAMRPPELLW